MTFNNQFITRYPVTAEDIKPTINGNKDILICDPVVINDSDPAPKSIGIAIKKEN